MIIYQGVILFLILFISPFNFCSGQYQEYALVVGGKKVGALKVYPQDSAKSVKVFKVESEFKMLFQNGRFSNTSIYSNGKLVQADFVHSLNGNTKERTNTKYKTSQLYEVRFNDEAGQSKAIQNITEPIHATLTTLFYKEPKGIRSVYSERFGQFCAVSKLSLQDYKVQMPDGKQNVYSYRDGRFFEMQTELAGFRLRIVRQ
ncbi:DUF6134 family protein [Dyadobacter tibetensis]|uniref:DUF6134 family protein n=1 Tax=Dyadobacter tibetensis TaxID=1211851 RepID=UPI00046E8A1B|nr:DUF6134 family protein [Dyadobacter tibetensis]